MKKWLKGIIGEVVADLLIKVTVELNSLLEEKIARLNSLLEEEKKRPPMEVFTRLSAEDVVRYGKALDELEQGPNYKYLV